MEAASKIGESYIALRENSFKLRSSFLTATRLYIPLRLKREYEYGSRFKNRSVLNCFA